MIAAYTILLSAAVLFWAVRASIRDRRAWPEPTPRPHVCDRCGWPRAYQSSHLLALHVRGQHPETFE